MSFKNLMSFKVLICLGFGPVLLFFPAWILNLLGADYGTGAAFMARLYGATLFGNLLLTWLGRKAQDSIARRAIIWDLFIYDAIGLVVTLVLLLKGLLGPLTWAIAALYLIFTLGFGYLALGKVKSD